jgi:hypothetical protein
LSGNGIAGTNGGGTSEGAALLYGLLDGAAGSADFESHPAINARTASETTRRDLDERRTPAR